jgi:hypothetical protein
MDGKNRGEDNEKKYFMDTADTVDFYIDCMWEVIGLTGSFGG